MQRIIDVAWKSQLEREKAAMEKTFGVRRVFKEFDKLEKTIDNSSNRSLNDFSGEHSERKFLVHTYQAFPYP